MQNLIASIIMISAGLALPYFAGPELSFTSYIVILFGVLYFAISCFKLTVEE